MEGISKWNSFINSIRSDIEKNIPLFQQKSGMEKLGQSDSIGNCPVCGKTVLSGKKNWYCTGYSAEPKCEFVLWKNICGKEISADIARTLVEGKKTSLMKGLKSSAGKKFDAYLQMDQNGKVTFEFPQTPKKNLRRRK